MTILAISTSTPHGSVAIVEGDRVLAEASHDDLRGHAEHLFTLIDEALARADRARRDLRLVACDLGPGSFTGVRIAVASAKGIAVGLGLPLAGVVSLEAMAERARAEISSTSRAGGDLETIADSPLIAAAIDAKKDELYVALYEGDAAIVAPSHLSIRAAAERIQEAANGRPVIAIAETEALLDFAGPIDRVARRLVAPPSASWVARIASRRVAARAGVGVEDASLDPAEVVPLYVRAPDAVPAISKAAGAFATLPVR